MHCRACGHANRDEARFCEACGRSLAARCPACGRDLRAEARFCDGCGASIAPAPARDPRDYTPRHLAERILTTRAALEGERKHVTVLFADVKGSVGLSSSVDPEEWHELLDELFEILGNGVHRFEGTVNQYTGDGIMAIFGAPLALEDHAQRACYAALHLRDALREHARRLRDERGLDLRVRVALNSGDVVVRSVGSDLRMDYTAVGQTTHLAARMEQLAPPGTVRLTPETSTAGSVGGGAGGGDMRQR